MKKAMLFLYKKRRYLYLSFIIIIFLLTIGYIAYTLGTNYENINEYYLYKKTGCNIYLLDNFVINASIEQKQDFFAYFNNLYLYPPVSISPIEITYIENLLLIRFIPIYDPWKIYILFYVLCASLWYFWCLKFIIIQNDSYIQNTSDFIEMRKITITMSKRKNNVEKEKFNMNIKSKLKFIISLSAMCLIPAIIAPVIVSCSSEQPNPSTPPPDQGSGDNNTGSDGNKPKPPIRILDLAWEGTYQFIENETLIVPPEVHTIECSDSRKIPSHVKITKVIFNENLKLIDAGALPMTINGNHIPIRLTNISYKKADGTIVDNALPPKLWKIDNVGLSAIDEAQYKNLANLRFPDALEVLGDDAVPNQVAYDFTNTKLKGSIYQRHYPNATFPPETPSVKKI